MSQSPSLFTVEAIKNDWMLRQWRMADKLAKGDRDRFVKILRDGAFKRVRNNPDMLRKSNWKLKKRIYTLVKEYSRTDIKTVKSISFGKYDEFIYSCGTTIDSWNENVVLFETLDGHEVISTDILSNDIDLLIVSNRLKNALESNNVYGTQFYKVKVKPEEIDFPSYWYAHIICVAGAFSYEKSDYDLYEEQISCVGIESVYCFRVCCAKRLVQRSFFESI